MPLEGTRAEEEWWPLSACTEPRKHWWGITWKILKQNNFLRLHT